MDSGYLFHITNNNFLDVYMMKDKYKSELYKAKNLGSAGFGASHWWHQRFTALILVFTALWVMTFFWQVCSNEVSGIIACLRKPYNIVMLLVLALTSIYHAFLGMQVIIEDYIKCRTYRLILLFGIKIFSVITVASFIVATIYVIIL